MKQDTNRNLVAAVSYVLLFVTGIVILFVEEDDKFIRFHAMQSTILTGGLFILNILVGILLRPLGFFAVISDFLGILIWIVILVVAAVSFVKAYQGKVYKWPIVGDFAESKVK